MCVYVSASACAHIYLIHTHSLRCHTHTHTLVSGASRIRFVVDLTHIFRAVLLVNHRNGLDSGGRGDGVAVWKCDCPFVYAHTPSHLCKQKRDSPIGLGNAVDDDDDIIIAAIYLFA